MRADPDARPRRALEAALEERELCGLVAVRAGVEAERTEQRAVLDDRLGELAARLEEQEDVVRRADRPPVQERPGAGRALERERGGDGGADGDDVELARGA